MVLVLDHRHSYSPRAAFSQSQPTLAQDIFCTHQKNVTAVQTVPFTVQLFELSSKMVAQVALPFPLWHHGQMFYTSQSTWGCTSHTRCSPVARERLACQWWVSGRWPPANISVKRKWCQTGDTSCLVSIHVGGIQVLWNQNEWYTYSAWVTNFQLQLSEELSSGHIVWPHINVTRQLLKYMVVLLYSILLRVLPCSGACQYLSSNRWEGLTLERLGVGLMLTSCAPS